MGKPFPNTDQLRHQPTFFPAMDLIAVVIDEWLRRTEPRNPSHVADGHLLELLRLQRPCEPICLAVHSGHKAGFVIPLPPSPGQFQVRLVRQGLECLGICIESRIEQPLWRSGCPTTPRCRAIRLQAPVLALLRQLPQISDVRSLPFCHGTFRLAVRPTLSLHDPQCRSTCVEHYSISDCGELPN